MGEARRRRLLCESLRESLASHFPTLRLTTDRGRCLIHGEFVVEHEGKQLDRFSIEVEVMAGALGVLPSVKEVGGRIPWDAARHVNHDGSACVCLPEDYFFHNPGRLDVVAFLEGPVRDFFIGQALVDAGDPWPFGEWDHGDAGCDEWLDEFGHSLTHAQKEAYVAVLSDRMPDHNAACPCGSGRILDECHLDLLTSLRKVPRAKEALRGIAQKAGNVGDPTR